jgi:phasin
MQMQSPASSFEIPAEMRAFAERSFEQARIAFDKFIEAAQSTMNTLEGQSKVAQAGAKEMNHKIMSFAEQNVATAFDYAQKLVQAKDPQSLMALHGEFIQSQMQVLAEQQDCARYDKAKALTAHQSRSAA